jgi:putative two-component system response regulator
MARDIAFTHHERFDGMGYPFGLRGTEIPLCGRITALADVYDALTSRRVYKDKMSHAEARKIILGGAGKHFDEDVVDAFLRRENDIIRISIALDQGVPAPTTSYAATALSPAAV